MLQRLTGQTQIERCPPEMLGKPSLNYGAHYRTSSRSGTLVACAFARSWRSSTRQMAALRVYHTFCVHLSRTLLEMIRNTKGANLSAPPVFTSLN